MGRMIDAAFYVLAPIFRRCPVVWKYLLMVVNKDSVSSVSYKTDWFSIVGMHIHGMQVSTSSHKKVIGNLSLSQMMYCDSFETF